MRAVVLRKMDASENYQLATSVRIALLSGMRRSEICALRWQDIDLENRVIHVSNSFTKDEGFKLDSPKDPCGGRVTRDIPIGGVLTRYLKEQKARQEDELAEFRAKWTDTIFVTGNPLDGSFFNPEMLGRQWSMLSDAESWKGTQGKKVTFHDLRHTFATLDINQEVMDVMSLAKILGHRDASVTLNVYADALADSKRKGMDALDGTLMLEEEDERPRGRHMRKL
jgi:integrase